MMRNYLAALVAAAVSLCAPALGFAFCGFYVAGSEGSLVSDATQVVMMRYGTTTIQSMQNNYKGPPEDFAMVVPVPQVLQEANVKTLESAAFDKIDLLTSPRLVEYWEQDPCRPNVGYGFDDRSISMESAPTSTGRMSLNSAKVKVEAKFSVAEYDIVILSTTESTALETWLVENGYKIPAGAAPYLAPYVEGGMYFFVAKVDVDKVKRTEDGRAVLSPIRFHYENDAFFLPVRLGMINSAGKQDLVVYVLGESFRYEVANRPNVFIPTNLEVKNEVRNSFAPFYESLFAAAVEETPGAVVTEYSWASSSCDPCPGPTLDQADILTFGGDVISTELQPWNWVVTRLHARYGVDDIGEDLVFEKAAPVVGGREVRAQNGALEQGAQATTGPATFQARYIIRHEWAGEANCENPQFGIWGGPPNGGSEGVVGAPSANTRGEAPPSEIAVDYASLLKGAAPTAQVTPGRKVQDPIPTPGKKRGMCAGCSTQQAAGSGFWLAVLAGLALVGRRRRRRNV